MLDRNIAKVLLGKITVISKNQTTRIIIGHQQTKCRKSIQEESNYYCPKRYATCSTIKKLLVF